MAYLVSPNGKKPSRRELQNSCESNIDPLYKSVGVYAVVVAEVNVDEVIGANWENRKLNHLRDSERSVSGHFRQRASLLNTL